MSANRLVRVLAAVCAVGLLGGLAVGVWFLGKTSFKCQIMEYEENDDIFNVLMFMQYRFLAVVDEKQK